jgi:hypothetical protein
MHEPEVSLLLTITLALASGLVGSVISIVYGIRQERRPQKLDTLRRIMSTRIALTAGGDVEVIRRFFEALNEVSIVYHDAPKVLAAIAQLHGNLSQPNRMFDDLITLAKAMFKNVRVKYEFNDSFFERPFTFNGAALGGSGSKQNVGADRDR